MIPTLTTVQMGLFQWLATHPLVRGGLVKDIATDEIIDIKFWRLRDGLIEKQKALYCSIIPFFGNSPGPSSTSVTAKFDSMSVSRAGLDHCSLLFTVKLDYATLPFKSLDYEFEVEDPKRFRRSEFLPDTEIFSLAVHPGLHIIGEYLEILRIAITDPRIEFQTPFLQVRPPQVLHFNVKAEPWNTETNVIWHTGSMLVHVESFIDRNWIANEFNRQVPEVDFDLDIS